MTDTTDTKALMRPVRDRYDWSNAVWQDCDHCGKQHTGTVTAEDGSQICAHCADQLYWSAWQVLAEQALDQLEAERQRAETLQTERDEFRRRLKLERSILEDADKQIAELKAKLANPNVLPVGEIVAWSGTDIEKGITREVDFRFLRFDVRPGQQLFTAPQKPVVVLTDCDIGAVSHMAHWYSEEQCEAWVAGVEHAKKQIVAAGCIVSDK